MQISALTQDVQNQNIWGSSSFCFLSGVEPKWISEHPFSPHSALLTTILTGNVHFLLHYIKKPNSPSKVRFLDPSEPLPLWLQPEPEPRCHSLWAEKSRAEHGSRKGVGDRPLLTLRKNAIALSDPQDWPSGSSCYCSWWVRGYRSQKRVSDFVWKNPDCMTSVST